jgi:hypothetical protein
MDNNKMTIGKAWKILFEKYDIVSKISTRGFFKIKSSEINKIKEARLMAKFDQSAQLPEVFQHNKLSILPVSRGEYIIGHFQTHEKLSYPKCKPVFVNIPNLETLDHTNLYDEIITLDDIIATWKSVKRPVEPIPMITFPQANSFARIIDLLSILFEHGLTKEDITMQYEFDPRQTDYYIAACDYLGLIERININGEKWCQLSEESRRIMALSFKQKNLALVKRVFERPVFYKSFEYLVRKNKIPDKNEICNIMNKSNLPINQTTIGRRSSTVQSWLDWILRIANSGDGN